MLIIKLLLFSKLSGLRNNKISPLICSPGNNKGIMKSDCACRSLYNNIRIHQEFEDGIEKSVRRNTIWHHVMPNGVPKDGFFLRKDFSISSSHK